VTVLELAGVVRRFGGVTALDGVDLAVEGGHLHCLAGSNGSGKTTLLEVALGLTRPDEGAVTVRGDAGASFQRPSFYADLTVAENLSVFGAVAGADPEWRSTLTGRLGLDAVAGRPAGDLSDGYARRLDLALALVGGPDLVLVDEPLADLDDVAVERVLDLLAAYPDPDDGAVVVATHRLDRFADVCDRLTVLDRGRVLFDGDPAELPGDRDATLRERYVGLVLGE